MTTQELKNKIERVLGNNIRCLLPSYWWKNLLHSVADRIDEVEQKIGDDSGITVVDSKEALYGLDLPKGSVATVTNEGIKPSECYQPTDEDMDNISGLLSKLTPVRNIELLTDQLIPGEEAVAILVESADSYMRIGVVGTDFVAVMVIGEQISYFYDINKLNEALASHDFRFLGMVNGSLDIMDRACRFNTSTDVYAKSASWDKLLKEGEESALNRNEVTFVIGFDERGEVLLTDEEKAANKAAYNRYVSSTDVKCNLRYYLTSDDGSIDHMFPATPQAALVGYSHLIGERYNAVTFKKVNFGNLPFRTIQLMGDYEILFDADGQAHKLPYLDLAKPNTLYVCNEVNEDNAQFRLSNQTIYNSWNNSYLPFPVMLWEADGHLTVMPGRIYKVDSHIYIDAYWGTTARSYELHSDGTTSVKTTFSLIDSEMSDDSTLAIQNRVVKKYIDDKVANIDFPPVDAELSQTSTNAVQNKAVYNEMVEIIRIAVDTWEYMIAITDALSADVDEADKVTAAALNDLNKRLQDITTRLDNAGL